jgi:hypothetical protein
MTPAAYLLVIPDDYAVQLSHLHWALDHDAVETEGGTFALAEEVGAFLDGFASRRPLMHFAHVLHFLYLLRVAGRGCGPLAEAWRQAGRPARTAGAFAAVLCEDVPSLASPVNADEVRFCLRQRVPLTDEAPSPVEDPPFTPAEFEAIVSSALGRYSHDELVHWLRHGLPAAPDASQRLAAEVLARPPLLGDVLDELGRHERLAGAAPLVARLVGALALPPRRLADRQLPIGGYSDVGTRGQPEQILPAQFALDQLEFVRRHAENELLYFQREEPHAPTCDRLVVLLDQGVRTWGRVRLALAGCLLALGETARRRKLSLTLAVSSNGGRPFDPLAAETASLGELVGASDLTPNPGLALERVLEEDAGPRDVVLLTHPRNLAEPELQAAARRAGADVRLFAVAVAASGEVTFEELRHGLPVRLGRFALDLDVPVPTTPTPEPSGEWRGPLEPVGFPFRFGPGGNHEPFLFAFDADGKHLLAALPHGLLMLMKRDGAGYELLPRVLFEGRLMSDVHGVLGVLGGFVVTGSMMGQLIAAHYDLATRHVRVHAFAAGASQITRGVEWRYLLRQHALALRLAGQYSWVRLATGRRDESFPVSLCWEPADPPNRLAVPLACDAPDDGRPWPRPRLRFDARHGAIDLTETPEWQPFTPTVDGKPGLLGRTLMRADCRGGVLAVLFLTPERGKELWLFEAPAGRTLATLPLPFDRDGFALSPDGRYLAVQRGPCQVDVREARHSGAVVGVSPVGRFHNNLRATLAEEWVAIGIDRRVHYFGWPTGALEYAQMQGDEWVQRMSPGPSVPSSGERAGLGQVPAFLNYDRSRFRLAACDNLVAVVTLFGEVFVFEQTGELVCGFFVFRQQAAAWLPDGTCWGAESLLGRPPTAGAADRIGKALSEAWRRGKRAS